MYKKMIALTIVAAGILLVAAPAKAFYLELPNVLKFWQGTTKAQEAPAEVMVPAPIIAESTLAPTQEPVLVPAPAPTVSPAPVPVNDTIFCNALDKQTTKEECDAYVKSKQTCRIDGVEMPGSCEQYNNQPVQYDSRGNRIINNVGMSGGGDNMAMKNGEQEQQMQQQNQDRQMKDMKRGITDVERQLKKFEQMVAKFEKQGVAASEELKTKISNLKAMIEKYKAASSVEEMQEMNMDELWEIMRDLEEERQNLERTGNVLREMKRIESGVKMFEKQIAKLAKQKISIPADITANLEKVKAIIADVKSGKIENAEDIFEAMQELDQSRGQLEMLSRWPQTLKEVDNQLKNLSREMKRAKTIVARLSKKGMDLSEVYAEFETAVNKMIETRAAAVAKMEAGESEDAFETIQNDFFGQMEDTWQGHKIIMTMNNFGQFNADFTRSIAQAQRQINALAKKKIDTAELKSLLEQAKVKGAEVKEMFKVKPIDPDSVMDALEELEDLRQEFSQLAAELSGVEEDMPWEKGPEQFKSIQVSPTLQNLIPRKETMQQPMNETQQPM